MNEVLHCFANEVPADIYVMTHTTAPFIKKESIEKGLTRLFYLVEHNLNENIKIGFHSHNNMQLAYSNAQSLVDLHSDRELIIDASVYGMGRGAGNLNTELFVQYLNDNADGTARHYGCFP